MKKAKLSLAWQILIGLVLGIAIGALLNHFSAEKPGGSATSCNLQAISLSV